MITRVDDRLREEAERFAFRFACESCVAFDPETEGCAHRYPNAAHRVRALEGVEQIVFCKEFEVG